MHMWIAELSVFPGWYRAKKGEGEFIKKIVTPINCDESGSGHLVSSFAD